MTAETITTDEIAAIFAKTPNAQAVSIWPTLDQTNEYLMLYRTEKAKKPFAMVSLRMIFGAIQHHGLLSMPEEHEELPGAEIH